MAFTSFTGQAERSQGRGPGQAQAASEWILRRLFQQRGRRVRDESRRSKAIAPCEQRITFCGELPRLHPDPKMSCHATCCHAYVSTFSTRQKECVACHCLPEWYIASTHGSERTPKHTWKVTFVMGLCCERRLSGFDHNGSCGREGANVLPIIRFCI